MSASREHRVLLASDSDATTRATLECLARRAVLGEAVDSCSETANRLRRKSWDLLLLDGTSLGGEALEFVAEASRLAPQLAIVLLAENLDARDAVRAMRTGCQDVWTEPVDGDTVERLLDAYLPVHDNATDKETAVGPAGAIIGKSEPLLQAVQIARKVAASSAPVLIVGESGTGKELVASFIHEHSARARQPYVSVNCAAVSETLLESELFGHERGAFTGAHSQHKGRFERADGGTILLDEISETGPRLQAELLRVLEQQDFERVGGAESVQVDVRVIATTNRDILKEVEEGNFRRDLYYRISGVRLDVPPLRERKEDLPELVWHFVNRYAPEARRNIRRLDAKMLDLFYESEWPGNVRQLRNVVRAALILGEGSVLSLKQASHLRAELGRYESSQLGTLDLGELERRAILEALRRTKSHQGKAADLLGITDRTLRTKLRRYRNEGRIAPLEEVA